MIETAIYSRISTAIGTDVTNRIYPLVAPAQVVAPLCVYNIASKQIDHALSGPTTSRHTHFQVDIYSLTKLEASTIAEKVVSSMSTWTATSQSIHVEDAGTDMIEDTVQPNLYRVSMRFIVHHQGS